MARWKSHLWNICLYPGKGGEVISACSSERERHLGRTCGVPGAEDDSPICGILFDFADALTKLVDALALVRLLAVGILGTKVSPLETIHWSEVTLPTVSQPPALKESLGAVTIPYLDALV